MTRARILPLLGLIVLLPACAAERGPMTAGELLVQGREDSSALAKGPPRLLIKRATLELEASDLPAVAAGAERVAQEVGGYLESSEIGEERLRLTLRVPVTELERALEGLARLGKLKNKRVSAEDVTEKVVDLEARLKNLIAVRDRLKKHLERTADLKDIIAVEQELTRVQSEIDSLEGRLKHLKSSAALSAITVLAERPTILGPVGYVLHVLWWGVSKLFVIQ